MTANKTSSSHKAKTSAVTKPRATRKPVPKTKPKPAKPPQKLQKEIPAFVYDFQGSMEITVPAQWKALLGKEAFKEYVQELAARSVVIVSREAGMVVYIHLPITVHVLGEST